MEIRYASSPAHVKTMDTATLRSNFLVEDAFKDGEINVVYTHHDRIVVGGAVPAGKSLKLETYDPLRTSYFMEGRELGAINVGTAGKITADGVEYEMPQHSALYIGRGTKDVVFEGDGAKYYLFSATSHHDHPTTRILAEEGNLLELGDQENSNKRKIRQLIHAGENGVKSSQIVMGFTQLAPGSMWNTMPAHTHDRRTECYLYTDLPEDARVFHMMGEPQETRHLVMANDQIVIAPSWSLHSGVGTKAYTFVWSMAGENQDYTDMDTHPVTTLK
jgi:4-deoxy-L-threo-5-hexosulose-uronate ketol-isomerase